MNNRTIELENGNKIALIEPSGEVIRGKRANIKSILYDDFHINQEELDEIFGKYINTSNPITESNKLVNIGVFAPSYEDLNLCVLFVNEYILGNNEVIKQQSFLKNGFEIITDKSHYNFKTACDGARGYRWHKVFLYGDIDEEILDNIIYPKIIPFDFENSDGWRMRDNVSWIK